MANPFDDIMPRSSRGMMELCNASQMHPSAQQQMCGPPMRGMNPMSSMGGMRAMMPHNMGAMSQMGSHMNAMGGMSTMGNPTAGRMSPLTNMGFGQPPGAMNQMGNHMNPMGGLSPLSNSPVGRMSPMGSNQPPGAMNQMGSHLNPMGGTLPMSHSPVGRMSPMGPNQPPGAMNQTGSHMNPMGGMPPMSNNPAGRMSPMNNMGSNQPPGAMRQMGNHMSHMGGMPPMGNPPGGRMSPMSHMRLNQPPGPMNPMAGMAPMGNPSVGRMSPMSSMGGHMNQSHMAHMAGNQMDGRAMEHPMGRPSAVPMNRMPGSIQNHMANGTMNGPSSMNDFNGLFGQNGSQPHNMGMNGHMNMANLARQINGPRATMGPMVPNNINVSGRNANYTHHNQIGGHMSSMTSNDNGTPPMGHAMNPGGNIGPHGFQARPATRLMAPTSGKVLAKLQSHNLFIESFIYLFFIYIFILWPFRRRSIRPISRWSSTPRTATRRRSTCAAIVTKK